MNTVKPLSFFCVLAMMLVVAQVSSGQLVQAGIFYNTGTTTLEVKVKPDAGISGIGGISNIVVTLRWLASYNVDLGDITNGTQTTGESLGFVKQGGEMTDGTSEYQIFVCVPAAGSITWTGNSEHLLFSTTVSGGSGTGTIEVANDEFTLSHLSDFYFEVGGQDLTNYTASFYHPQATNVLLPVTLSSMSASLQRNAVELVWETASELGTARFEVERKDMSGWNKRAEIAAAGQSSAPIRYSYTDEIGANTNGRMQYRLKMVDLDGSFKYSAAVEVVVVPTQFELSQNFPNPFNPTTKIRYSLPEAANVSLRIFDLLGREVAQDIMDDRQPGYYEYVFGAGKIAAGAYLYQLTATANGKVVFNSVKKMILLK